MKKPKKKKKEKRKGIPCPAPKERIKPALKGRPGKGNKSPEEWTRYHESIYTHALSHPPETLLLEIRDSKISPDIPSQIYRNSKGYPSEPGLYITENPKKVRAFFFQFFLEHSDKIEEFIPSPDGYKICLEEENHIRVIDAKSPHADTERIKELVLLKLFA